MTSIPSALRNGFFAIAIATTPLMVASTLSTVALADEKKQIARINVNGEGKVNVAPDMATLMLGVRTEAETAREALDDNNRKMAEIIAAMKASDIADKDLQTSNFSIQPKYVYHRPKKGEEQKPPRIVGYTVSNDLAVRIRDLARVGEVLDKSVTLGVNSGGHIQFGNDDPSKAISKARAEAMKDAMDRAKTLVEVAGASLGRILSINESFQRPHPVPMAKGRMMAESVMADAVPIEGGENTYSITVSASWEIKQ